MFANALSAAKVQKITRKAILFYLFPFNTSDGETRAEAVRKELWGWHGRSGMEGAVWKVLEGMVDMDGMEGMDGIRCKDTTFL